MHIINKSCKFDLFFVIEQIFRICRKVCGVGNRAVRGGEINKSVFINEDSGLSIISANNSYILKPYSLCLNCTNFCMYSSRSILQNWCIN